MGILDLLRTMGGQPPMTIPGFGGTNVRIPGMTPGYGDDPLEQARQMGLPGGVVGNPPAPKSSIIERAIGGLLGPSTNYGGILDAGAQGASKNDAKSAIIASLLSASGPSAMPTSLGQAIGGAMTAGRTAQNESLDNALRAQLMKSQISKNERGDLPTSAEEYEYFKKLPPEEQKIYQEMRAKAGPAAIQEFQYFKGLSPEDQQTYIKLQRQPTVPKVVMIGNVPHLVDPVTGSRTPLSSLENEATGAQTVKEAEGRGGAFGKAAGELAASIQKKGSDATAATKLLTDADSLIDIATGSVAGNVRDKFASAFGYATEPAQAIAELKVLQANLMLQQPRMEGPQSDRDVSLYKEAAGQIGDPNVPADLKKAALRRILALQDQYRERAADAPVTPSLTAPPSQPSAGAKKKYNPATGKIE